MNVRNVELLSPAGSYESAIAGIQNGCDALYMAGTKFGARAYASNFDPEQLTKIIAYAHAYGVKVYITLNTLIHDAECEECFSYIAFLYELNVDALIVQDLGILEYVRSHYPDFEVHASTQMHIVNEHALAFLASLNVKRAVLAREVTLPEIKRFSKQKIELEVFVHGALCVAYSGQCLMSFMIGKRSGNRGECAQTCRMPYRLCDFNTKQEYAQAAYLLSLKDLNTLDHVDKLIAAGIDSFKIEGRMKKSEYVAHITALYRSKI
ncbi:MAG: U32 family peptidase, partial [Erysipelotrichia bacterium]|nr:U32 family peptidase [Erysipelotrichia bacterium]